MIFLTVLGYCVSRKIKTFSLKVFFLRVIYLQIVCFHNILCLTLPCRHNLALLLTLYIVFFLTHSLLKFLSCTPLRSLSDSVLHLLLHSSLHCLSSLLSFFLFLHQYFLLSWSVPFSIRHFAFFTFSLLFSYFLPLFLLISLYLSFIVLLFDSPSLFHTPLPFSPSSTTFRWEVFHSTDDQKVITCSQLTAA